MDDSTFLLGFVLICLNSVPSTLGVEDTCVQKTACSCEFSNGTGIDLSASAASSFLTAQIYELKENGTQYELSTYYYHPCYDAVPSVNGSTPDSTCGGPLSICRQTNKMNLQPKSNGTYQFVEGNYEFMGTSNLTQFTMDPNGISIVYFNGPSSSVVMLICAETTDKLHVYSTAEPNRIILSLFSRNACLREMETGGRSTGSTLLIIFFSFVIFYLVLGICTKKFLMGATGIEVVPNLAFWSDLPNLVKDGWAFTLNGFKLPTRGSGPVTSPDPNSYDSI